MESADVIDEDRRCLISVYLALFGALLELLPFGQGRARISLLNYIHLKQSIQSACWTRQDPYRYRKLTVAGHAGLLRTAPAVKFPR